MRGTQWKGAEKPKKGSARAFLAVTAMMVVLSAGCTVGPKYNRASVPTPPAYKELTPDQVGEWQTAHPNDAASRGQWWTIFGDPQLDTLEQKADAANQNIAAAAASYTAARSLVREARSQYFPTLGTAPSITYQQASPAQFGGLKTGNSALSNVKLSPYAAYTLPADVSWEPDLWGRVRNTVRGAAAAAQAGAADLANVRLSSEGELALDYYELRNQDALKQLLDATVANYQQTVDLTQSLYRAGLDNDEALAQAEAQLKAAQAQDTNLGILRAQYEHAIAVLAGQPPSTFSIPALPLEAKPPVIPAGVPADLLERRPDIAAAERTMEQANAQIGVAKAAYYPNVTLMAEGGFGNTSIADWFAWPSRFWSVGPQLAETIFDAGLRRATVEQYQATYDQTVAAYRQTVLGAFQEVEDNLAALRILAQDIQQQDGAVQAAQRSLQEATTRFQSGLDPYLNVLVAQMILLNDQQTAVNFRGQQMEASVQLIEALGGGWGSARLPTPKQLSTNVSSAPNSSLLANH